MMMRLVKNKRKFNNIDINSYDDSNNNNSDSNNVNKKSNLLGLCSNMEKNIKINLKKFENDLYL